MRIVQYSSRYLQGQSKLEREKAKRPIQHVGE